MDANQLKKDAALEAVKFIKSNQILGLGTGSTIFYVLEAISEKLKNGELENIKGVPSSNQTFELAEKFGIPLTTLDKNPLLDLNIDGADEVDKNLNLIKGGGGALLKEKIIAQASKKNIFVVDESKLSIYLAEKFFVPVEVVPFAANSVFNYFFISGFNPRIRTKDDKYFLTDQNNFIIDLYVDKITDPIQLSNLLHNRAGVVEHGLFIGFTNILLVGKHSGVEVIRRDF